MATTRPLRRLAAMLLALAPLSASVAAAGAADGGRIVREGNGAGAPPCVACHGPTGMGEPATGFPRLAGLTADYLDRQLVDFQNGTRNHPAKTPMAKALTAEERRAVVGYYASLPVTPRPKQGTADAALLVRGQRLAQDGDWAKGVPACYLCHGPNGEGVPPHFPGIIDQPKMYIAAQIAAWQQGTRSNDPQGLMRTIAGRLTAEEIEAVAAWLSSLSLPAGKP